MDTVAIVGRDSLGIIAELGGLRYYLTECCRSSATGVQATPTNPAGVACRGCYAPIDPRLGGLPEQTPEMQAQILVRELAAGAARVKAAARAVAERFEQLFPATVEAVRLEDGVYRVTLAEGAERLVPGSALIFDEYAVARGVRPVSGYARWWNGKDGWGLGTVLRYSPGADDHGVPTRETAAGTVQRIRGRIEAAGWLPDPRA